MINKLANLAWLLFAMSFAFIGGLTAHEAVAKLVEELSDEELCRRARLRDPSEDLAGPDQGVADDDESEDSDSETPAEHGIGYIKRTYGDDRAEEVTA